MYSQYLCSVIIDLSHEHFMKEALKEAEKARAKDEVPVGAVVVCENRIIARAHNLTETLNDVTAHAEMQAITAAASYLGGKYLEGCILYVTLEPCSMCAGALFWARPMLVVFGASDAKRGYTLVSDAMLHPKTEVLSGVMEEECSSILRKFFSERR